MRLAILSKIKKEILFNEQFAEIELKEKPEEDKISIDERELNNENKYKNSPFFKDFKKIYEEINVPEYSEKFEKNQY